MPEQSINIYRYKNSLTFWDGTRNARPDSEKDTRVALFCQVLPPEGAEWWTAGGPFGEEVVIPKIDRQNGFTPGGLLLAARNGMFGLSVWAEGGGAAPGDPAPPTPTPRRAKKAPA